MNTRRPVAWIVLIGVAAAAVAVTAAEPPTSRPAAAARLRVIGEALGEYVNENRGFLPPSLGYTLAVLPPPPGLADALTTTSRPTGFDTWSVDRRSAWTDAHTDVLYLQGWQHLDARITDGGGFSRPGTGRRAAADNGAWSMLVNGDGSIEVLLPNGAAARYAPVPPGPSTTRPATDRAEVPRQPRLPTSLPQ